MPTTTADPATATGTSDPTRRHRALAAALALAGAAALAACGGSASDEEGAGPVAPSNPAAFTWVHPQQAPAGWHTRELPSGQATLAYPGAWRLTRTDPGTVTATMRRNGAITGYLNITPQGGAETLAYPGAWRLTRTDPGTVTATMRRNGAITGYLNITPQGGAETLANWAGFRPAHNREEGDRNLVPLASAGGLRFTDGRGSCVKDSYSTSTGRRYTEIACIVRGAAATTVIVGAATPGQWDRVSPTLERAITSFDATA
jgi:hypothetical protein